MKPTPGADDNQAKAGKGASPPSDIGKKAADVKAAEHSKGWRNSSLTAPE